MSIQCILYYCIKIIKIHFPRDNIDCIKFQTTLMLTEKKWIVPVLLSRWQNVYYIMRIVLLSSEIVINNFNGIPYYYCNSDHRDNFSTIIL